MVASRPRKGDEVIVKVVSVCGVASLGKRQAPPSSSNVQSPQTQKDGFFLASNSKQNSKRDTQKKYHSTVNCLPRARAPARTPARPHARTPARPHARTHARTSARTQTYKFVNFRPRLFMFGVDMRRLTTIPGFFQDEIEVHYTPR